MFEPEVIYEDTKQPKIELYHDNLQNYKRYNIPPAQLVIEEYIEYGHDLYPALKKMENNSRAWKKTYDWYRKNTHTFVNAYLTGKYEVEERELTVKKVIEEHIELLKKQEVAVNLKPYYDLWEELKDE